ncbi:MAG TPA: hypothetical protein VIL47_01675, partial [Candidatus Bipolaricaulota bacterium]
PSLFPTRMLFRQRAEVERDAVIVHIVLAHVPLPCCWVRLLVSDKKETQNRSHLTMESHPPVPDGREAWT